MRWGATRPPLDLGHRTYLKAKAVGESSMSEKARRREAIKRRVRRGPDGMVKPTLAEPQCPICKVIRPGMMDETWCHRTTGHFYRRRPVTRSEGGRAAYSHREDMKRAPSPS